MVLPWQIYREAEADGIEVHFMHFEDQPALSVPGHIGIDTAKLPTTAEESTAAAHELGHDRTGAYYRLSASPEERQKCENRAERYAIKHYIPREALFEAVNSGLTEYWQLAEHFGFTEDFVRKAVCLYAFGNLSAELYL